MPISSTNNWQITINGSGVWLHVISWTNSQIIISGLTGAYGLNDWVLNGGPGVSVYVKNPQAGLGADYETSAPVLQPQVIQLGSATVSVSNSNLGIPLQVADGSYNVGLTQDQAVASSPGGYGLSVDGSTGQLNVQAPGGYVVSQNVYSNTLNVQASGGYSVQVTNQATTIVGGGRTVDINPTGQVSVLGGGGYTLVKSGGNETLVASPITVVLQPGQEDVISDGAIHVTYQDSPGQEVISCGPIAIRLSTESAGTQILTGGQLTVSDGAIGLAIAIGEEPNGSLYSQGTSIDAGAISVESSVDQTFVAAGGGTLDVGATGQISVQAG